MLRLAITGAELDWRPLTPRLRGASVESYVSGVAGASVDTCDAVVVLDLTPAGASEIQRLLTARKHVLLTPSAGLSGDALQKLSTAAQDAGVQLALSNPDRFLPSRQLICQQLDAGKLGDPGLVRSHRWEHAPGASQREDLPEPLLRDLDIALWLMGKTPNMVYALQRGGDGDASSTAGRTIQVHLGFAGDGMALIDYSATLPEGDGYQSLSLIGSAGSTYADDHHNAQLVYRGGRPQAIQVGEGGRETLAMVQSFVSGLSDGTDLSASASSWRSVLNVAEAAHKSVNLGRAVLPY